MTTSIISKKLIGSLSLGLILLATLIALSGRASALFSFFGNDLSFTATVTQVDTASFQVDKGGTYPFVIVVDSSTSYSNGISQLADLEIGDEVKVDTREHQGMLVANRVMPATINGYGYGAGCTEFSMSQVWLSSVEQDVLFLSRANITITANYDTSTEVLPGDQSIDDLEIGETFTVIGTDCEGDGIYAQSIIRNVLPGTEEEIEISCSTPGATVFSNMRVLLSHDEGGAFTPLQDVDLINGTYDVYGVSFDHHDVNAWDTTPLEKWYAEMYSNSDLVASTEATDDLPTGINRNVTLIASALNAQDIDQIRFVHDAFPEPNYNSIIPECLVLVPVDPAPEAIIEQ